MFIELTTQITNKTINIAVDNIAMFADDITDSSGVEKCNGGVIVFKSMHRQIAGSYQWRSGYEFLVKETAEEIKKKLFDISFGNQLNQELQK